MREESGDSPEGKDVNINSTRIMYITRRSLEELLARRLYEVCLTA